MSGPLDNDENLREIFRGLFHGRELSVAAPLVVFGSPRKGCSHKKVLYADGGFSGEGYWCDKNGCDHHVRRDYSPNAPMIFPPGALIAVTNPKFGDGEFYSFRADDEGKAQPMAHGGEWFPRDAA